MLSNGEETILILGGDGYLGWSLGLAFAHRTNKQVVLIDSLVKRKWEKEVDAKLLVPLKKPSRRISEYNRIFKKSNLSFEKVELLDEKAVEKMIKKYKPTVIINAAQQPSAPFSMMSPKHTAITFSNNIVGHLNVLWAIAKIDKSITYIKLGSAGCYMDTDTDFVPITKKDLSFEHRGKSHKILQSFIPMQATDFYHQSKISDFLIDDLCANVWKLKIITVQQATIFGATIDENHPVKNHMLSARFNYDAVFSTVLNRFICQLAIGHPLTIYGDGEQTTGLISLTDTVNNFMKFTDMDIRAGQHVVVHNYSHRLSIKDIAQKIANVESIEIQYIDNPRREGKGKLSKTVEMHPIIKNRQSNKDEALQKELTRMIDFTKRYKDNIDASIIMPKVEWTVEEAKLEKTAGFRSKLISIKKFRQFANIGAVE